MNNLLTENENKPDHITHSQQNMVDEKISSDVTLFPNEETLEIDLSADDDQLLADCLETYQQLYGELPADGTKLYPVVKMSGTAISDCPYSSRELVAVLQILSDLYGTTAFNDGRLVTLFDTIEETATVHSMME